MNTFENLLRMATENDKSSHPPVHEKKSTSGDGDRFAEDIKALSTRYPMEPNGEIVISLQELLTLCPRTRRRTDAYRGLTAELGRRGICLTINNKKV
jgi:hypothetical protein